MLDSMINKLARQFRIEQRIDPDRMLLITDSYLGTRIIYTHEMPLDPLYELLRDRLLNDLDKTTDVSPSKK